MRLLWKTHFKYIMTRILYICRFGHLGFYHYHCNSHNRINEHWILVQSQDKWLLRAFCTSHGWFRSWSLVFVFPQPDSFPARFFFLLWYFLFGLSLWFKRFYLVFIFSRSSIDVNGRDLWLAAIALSSIAFSYLSDLSKKETHSYLQLKHTH